MDYWLFIRKSKMEINKVGLRFHLVIQYKKQTEKLIVVITFPRVIGRRAIAIYIASILVVNVLFFNHFLPFIWWVFGIVEVTAFFYFVPQLTIAWQRLQHKTFIKKLFWTAFIIRLVWVFFSYWFYTSQTGQPFEFDVADALAYHKVGSELAERGFSAYNSVFWGMAYSDRGYGTYLGMLYMIFGDGVIVPRIIKAILGSLTVVLIYKLSGRTFNESTGRIAGVIAMLMPNLIYYNGSHLKETEMLFLTMVFFERVDWLFRNKTFSLVNTAIPMMAAVSLFFFRTVLGAAVLFSVATAVIFLPSKVTTTRKRLLLGLWISLLLFYFMGSQIATEVQEVWNNRSQNQSESMEWRSKRANGNVYAKYAGASVFAPLIFVIPFPTEVNTYQENQQLIHGGNFDKNIIGFFVMFALFYIITEKRWRDYLLPLSFMIAYLAVIAFSAFAQSERFHQPALPFEIMFAAYGISRLNNKNVKYYNWFTLLLLVIIIGWSWFKLSGREMV